MKVGRIVYLRHSLFSFYYLQKKDKSKEIVLLDLKDLVLLYYSL